MTKRCPLCGRPYGLLDLVTQPESCADCWRSGRHAEKYERRRPLDSTNGTDISVWAIASMFLGVATWASMTALFVRSEAALLLPFGSALCALIAGVGGLIDVAISRGKKRGLALSAAGPLLAIGGVYVFIRICGAAIQRGLAW